MNAMAWTSMAATDAWTSHLAGVGDGGPVNTQDPLGVGARCPDTTLSMAEAQRVQRYRDRLIAAVQSKDRSALRNAKQEVLEDAFRSGAGPGRNDGCATGSPAMRRALRDLCWRMAGLMLPRHRSG